MTIKMKKLINWAECPVGVETNFGQLCITDKLNRAFCFCEFRGTSVVYLNELRLEQVSHQPWLVYEEGITVIPEWAYFEYRGFTAGIGGHIEKYSSSIAYVAHYRIVGIKDGWTDNPNEATSA
jgi:hypothetical protein